jgi:hypothetical protein
MLKARPFPPSRTVFAVVSILTLVTGYVYAKYFAGYPLALVPLLSLDGLIGSVSWIVSARGQTGDAKSFGWRLFDALTDEGLLPSRLLAIALGFVIGMALAGEVVHLKSTDDFSSQNLGVKFVERDLYWSGINFLNSPDGAVTATGVGRSLEVITRVAGLVFFGMFVAVLVVSRVRLSETVVDLR